MFTRYAKFSLKSLQSRLTQSDRQLVLAAPACRNQSAATGPDHIIRLEAHNIPAFQKEDFMPPENELKSRVDFVYSYDPPETDNDKFWRASGQEAQ